MGEKRRSFSAGRVAGAFVFAILASVGTFLAGIIGAFIGGALGLWAWDAMSPKADGK